MNCPVCKTDVNHLDKHALEVASYAGTVSLDPRYKDDMNYEQTHVMQHVDVTYYCPACHWEITKNWIAARRFLQGDPNYQGEKR